MIPKETWMFRKSRMSPQVSRMEEQVRIALTKIHVRFETDVAFCLQSTTPDLYFPKQRLAVYLDGAVHSLKRGDRDEALRELLTKRHDVKVLSIPYKGNSRKTRDTILQQILEALEQ